MNPLDIRILGPLQARLDGRELDLGTRKQRALLALLIANRGRAVSTDRIVAALWSPDTSAEKRRREVWVYVSRLRKALGAAGEALGRTAAGYEIDVPNEAVDADRFGDLVEQAAGLLESDPPAASLVLKEALANWSGDAYGEFTDEDFVAAGVARLEESRLLALEMLAEADLAWRNADELIPELEGLVTAYPHRSRLTAALMLVLYRRGRQADALRAYRTFADALAAELGLDPPDELKSLEERILLDDPVLTAPLELPTRLPERIAPFVGRRAELAEVAEQLEQHRLVTLAGPGGIGKTTLALEVARRLAPSYADLALVDLGAAEQSQDCVRAVTDALLIRGGDGGPIEVIAGRLASRRVLLVLDNCEPVVGSVAEMVVALLERVPGLRVLATSRFVLGVPGERLVQVPLMSTDPHGEAMQLLTGLIASLPAAIRQGIDETAIEHLCVRTAGLPLAIELAVAQLRTWSVLEVTAALDDPLETLADPGRAGPERHRELRASIAWSEGLLPADAATLLARLSVFRSGFEFGAASPVAGFDPLNEATVRSELRRLVDASLLLVQPGSSNRYYMLAPVQQYAAERLEASGEVDVVAGRHAGFFVECFERLSPAIRFGLEADALDRARTEAENLTAALHWATAARDADLAQRGVAAAIQFWRQTAGFDEVLPMVDAALGLSKEPTRMRARVLDQAIPLYGLAQGWAAWEEKLAELQAAAELVDDAEVSGWAALRAADVAAQRDVEPDEVIALYRRALDMQLETGSRDAERVYHQLAWYLYWQGDRYAEADAAAAAWLELATERPGEQEEGRVRSFLAWLGLARGDWDRLERESAAAAAAYRRLGDHRAAAQLMHPLAIGSLGVGDVAEARRRIDVAVAAGEEAGAAPWLVNSMLARACINLSGGDRSLVVDDLRVVRRRIGPVVAPDLAGSLAGIAARMVLASDPEAAAVLVAAAERLGAGNGLYGMTPRLLLPILDSSTGGPEADLAGNLDPEALRSARASGSELDTEETMALVAELLQV